MDVYNVKLSIRSKLFLTLLAATSGVVLCIYIIMKTSFNHGFLNYINKQEQQYYQYFSKTLAIEWQKTQSWSELKSNRRSWRKLMRTSFGRFNPLNSDKDEKLPPRALNHPPFLLDDQKNVIYGNKSKLEHVILYPIMVDHTIVGYLGQRPKTRLTQHLDLVFAKQQNQAFLFTSLLMIVISALATLPIAYHLVKPIRRLIQGTHKLTAGDYQERIPIESQDELGHLSTDFNTLAHTLHENEKSRKQWVADISHELRTPLAILKGEIEALQDGIYEPTPDSLASLHAEVEHINRLINDLYELSMSDIGALSYQKQLLNPIETLHAAINSFQPLFKDKGIDLKINDSLSEPIQILADKDRLQQLFNNLLNNSLRYTDSPGNASIRTVHTGNSLDFYFEDSAPSVSEKELAHLFERLYRVESSRNRASGGAGLGLSICSNITHAHKGQISASASSLGGLKVYLSLPIEPTSLSV